MSDQQSASSAEAQRDEALRRIGLVGQKFVLVCPHALRHIDDRCPTCDGETRFIVSPPP